MKQKYALAKLTGAILFLASTSVSAKENVLSIDPPLPHLSEFSFPNHENIQPDVSPFEILNVVPMSSESGERWALLTVKNLEGGQRTLNQNHLIALLANGQRISPEKFSLQFKGNDLLSISVKFGKSKFPVLMVHSRN